MYNYKRRIPQYLIGLLVMALGIVTISQANVGISPVSVIPFALSSSASLKMTTLSFGWLTTFFHFFCIICQIIMNRNITVKTLLQFVLALVFGRILDGYKLLFGLLPFVIADLHIIIRIIVCFIGILISALGIVIIVGADFMLPPPDAFMRAFSARFNKKLSKVKICFDIIWIILTIIIVVVFALVTTGSVPWEGYIYDGKEFFQAIHIGTVMSAILTGIFVGIFAKAFKKLNMGPSPDKVLIGKKN